MRGERRGEERRGEKRRGEERREERRGDITQRAMAAYTCTPRGNVEAITHSQLTLVGDSAAAPLLSPSEER